MKTQIFKDYSEFVNREDAKVNGVSFEFAEVNPNFETDNETNEGCWNCSDCSSCSYCRSCSDCRSCSYCEKIEKKADVQKEKGETPAFIVPVIENIHQKIL